MKKKGILKILLVCMSLAWTNPAGACDGEAQAVQAVQAFDFVRLFGKVWTDPWIWMIIAAFFLMLFILTGNRYVNNKLLFPVYVFIPLFIFYFWQSNFYWESSVSLPPHIELSMLLLTAVLSFIAFYVQYEFNAKQKRDIDDERVENNFFRMYEEHLRLCDSINAKEIGSNKRAFHFIYYEIQTLTILLNYYFEIFVKEEPVRRKLKKNARFISFSLVLTGITRKSNYNMCKRMALLFQDDEDVRAYFGLDEKGGRKELNENLRDFFNFIECLQVIKDEHLNELQQVDELILYVDYADSQLKRKQYVPWFGGHRPDLVRYFKSLANMLFFLRTNPKIRTLANLHRWYDFMFSHMSEHEIGLVFIFSNSPHEFMQILGIIPDKEQPESVAEKDDPEVVKTWYKKKVAYFRYPEVRRKRVRCERAGTDDCRYVYEWDEAFEKDFRSFRTETKDAAEKLFNSRKHIDEILKSVALNWMLRTNEMYNYWEGTEEIDCGNEKIRAVVKEIGETEFSVYRKEEGEDI